MGKKKTDTKSNLGRALFKSRFGQGTAIELGGTDRWVKYSSFVLL